MAVALALLLLCTIAGLSVLFVLNRESRHPADEGRPSVIFMISDGFSPGKEPVCSFRSSFSLAHSQ